MDEFNDILAKRSDKSKQEEQDEVSLSCVTFDIANRVAFDNNRAFACC